MHLQATTHSFLYCIYLYCHYHTLSVVDRLLFIEISPEEYQLLGYFGLIKEVLPQVNWQYMAAGTDYCHLTVGLCLHFTAV